LFFLLMAGWSSAQTTVSISATQDGNEAGLVNGEFTVTVSNAPLFSTVEVFFEVDAASTADSGSDFDALPPSVSITILSPSGVGSGTIVLEPDQDGLIEGTETVIVNLLDDAAYDPNPVNNSATVTILDDDFGLVTIVATDENASEVGSDEGEYTIDLGGVNDTQDPVTVNYGLGGITDAVSGVDFEVLPGSVDIAVGEQTAIVALVPIDDDFAEVDETVRVNLLSTSDPILFPIADAGSVSVGINRDDVTIESDEVPGFTVGPISNNTGEDGTNATFDVELTGRPEYDVVLTVVCDDPSEGTVSPASLTFTDSNWNIPQTVTVTGVDDFTIDGDQDFDIIVSVDDSASPDDGEEDFDGLPDQNVGVTNIDDDVAGLTVVENGGTTQTSESGTTDTFTVVLNTQPVDDVRLSVVSLNVAEGSVAPANLTFTNANWNLPQTVTVTGVDDDLIDGDTVYDVRLRVLPAQSDDAYDDLVDELVSVSNLDDDVAGIRVVESGGGTETSESGGTDSFRVALTAQPQDNVVLSVVSLDNGEVSVSSSNLTFTSANWDTLQTVTVTGVDDAVVDGDQTVNVRLRVIDGSSDDDFDGVADRIVAVTNEDDDVVGINVDTTIGTTSEIGVSAIFEFTLNSQPTADVIIPISGYDTTEGNGPNQIVIAPSTWQTGVDLVVNGIDDVIDDGDVTYTLITGDVTSTDSNYNSLSGADVPNLQITNQDNDQAVITVVGAAVDEDVSTGELNLPVTLDIEKPGGFEVDYTLIGGTATAGVDFNNDPGTITFLGNAGETQLITVPIVNDNLLENSESFTVQLSTPTNDVLLNGDGTANGTILDDDNCLPSPILDTDEPTAFCDTLNADLNDYIIGNPPSGAELIWSTSSNQNQESAYRQSTVSLPGTYFGFYIDQDENCFSPTVEVTLVINETPQIESTAGGLRCGTGEVSLNATASVGASLVWFDSETGLSIFSGPSFQTPTISETTTYFVAATANGCTSARIPVIATVNNEPSTGTASNATACSEVGPSGTTILDLDTTLTEPDIGVWAITTDPSNGGVVINTDNTVDFAGLALGNYIFTYTTTGAEAPCTNQSVDVTITVIDCLLDADFDGLNDDIEEEIGTDPNNPDTDGDGIEDGQEVNVDGTDPLDDCDSVGGNPLPDTDCDNDGLTNAEENDLGTNPFDSDSDDDGLTDGEEVLVEDDPSTDAVPENSSDPLDDCDPFLTDDCNADPIDIAVEKTVDNPSPLLGEEINFTITVTNLSMEKGVDIVVSDLIDGDSGFELISSTLESGNYDPITGNWSIPELLGEASTNLFVTVRVAQLGRLENTASLIGSVPNDGDISNNSATAEVTVAQSECVDVGTICNLFSPNGDGVNDTLVLVGHENFPNNQLQIFDRYGNLIYFDEGYDSTWDGTGDNGNLPRGTYFYILNLGNGSDLIKGWIQIIR